MLLFFLALQCFAVNVTQPPTCPPPNPEEFIAEIRLLLQELNATLGPDVLQSLEWKVGGVFVLIFVHLGTSVGHFFTHHSHYHPHASGKKKSSSSKGESKTDPGTATSSG